MSGMPNGRHGMLDIAQPAILSSCGLLWEIDIYTVVDNAHWLCSVPDRGSKDHIVELLSATFGNLVNCQLIYIFGASRAPSQYKMLLPSSRKF